MTLLSGPRTSRRHLLSVGALLAASRMTPVTAQPVASPDQHAASSFPDLPEGIRPAPVNDEVDLLYVRVLSGIYGMTVVGEFQSRVDAWITAPPIVLRFDDGIELQPFTLRPNIPPFGRGQFHSGGTFLNNAQVDTVKSTEPDAIVVTLCEFDTGDADTTYGGLTVSDSDVQLNLDQETFTASVTMVNQGDLTAPEVQAFALIYDEQRYYCGELRSSETQRVDSGQEVRFSIELGTMNYGYLNPFEFVDTNPFILFIGGHAAEYHQTCV